MKLNKKIKKVLTITGWTILSAGLIVLLVAAINKKSLDHCAGIVIEMEGGDDNAFVSEEDVLNIITAISSANMKGKPIASFHLRKLESTLEKNVWIKDAELYFDYNKVLQVQIKTRKPVARIFNTAGASFYIDSSLAVLPLHEATFVQLPVFTNFSGGLKQWNKQDSVLITDIKNISAYITADSFWNAQIAQTDITAKNTFEMVPAIGNHLIVFGNGERYQEKFEKLKTFYKKVLSVVGFEKYSIINVQYEKQIVGTKRGSVTKVDSLLALKRIRWLIEESKHLPSDTSQFTLVDKKIGLSARQDSSLRSFDLLPPDAVAATDTNQRNPTPVKVPSDPNPAPVKTVETNSKQQSKPIPKAVMKQQH